MYDKIHYKLKKKKKGKKKKKENNKNPNSWQRKTLKIQSNATCNFTKCFYCQEGKRPMENELRILVGETGNEDALGGKQLIY